MIYILPDFLLSEECEKYIDLINTNKNIIPFTDSGKFNNNKWIDSKQAELFYKKLQTYKLTDNIIRPNNIIMTGKYGVGDTFSLHTDTGLYYNSETKEKTQWTLLIYLNDNFKGGETIFYDNDWVINKIIVPKKGCAILFDISLWHKANEILEGNKFWIGCEIIGIFL